VNRCLGSLQPDTGLFLSEFAKQQEHLEFQLNFTREPDPGGARRSVFMVCKQSGRLVWLALILAGGLAAENTGKIVHSVEIGGGRTFPGLQTRPGEPLDPDKVQRDVERLWDSGEFEDIQVESTEVPEGVDLLFRVKQKRPMRLRKIQVDPPTPGVNPPVEPNSPIDRIKAHQYAAAIRSQLVSSGFPDARVQAELIPVEDGLEADLQFKIDKGAHYKIESVAFSGDLGVPERDLRHALKNTGGKRILPGLPSLWKGWVLRPDFNHDAIQSDIGNLRSYYYLHGYLNPQVKVDALEMAQTKATLSYDIKAGPRYSIRQVNIHGAEGLRQITPLKDSSFPAKDLCKALIKERREAQKTGVIDFFARVEYRELPGLDERKWADLDVSFDRGPAYRIRRIDFRGNHAVSDTAIRGALLFDEGAPLNDLLVRKSLARLNRMGLFEPLSEQNVVVNTPPGSTWADMMISVKEKKRGFWNFSGPVGPMSLAGPLQLAIGSRLPAWGRGALELSTYAASISFMGFASPVKIFSFMPQKRFLVLATLSRPLIPGQRFVSGFTIAPQLGWQGMLAGYGMSQAHHLIDGLLESERAYTPGLPVAISPVGEAGTAKEGMLYCEPPKTRMDWVKQGAAIGVNVLFSLGPF
jgi:hypothetical protein